jgi:hypothetical protein
LICAGAAYLSDEFAIVDSTGLVHPFPQPLLLRSAIGKVNCPPAELGAAVATEPLTVGTLLFTKYEPDAVFQPLRLTQGMAMLEFLKHVVAVRRYPARALQVARSVTSSCRALRSMRGDAHHAATALLREVSVMEIES